MGASQTNVWATVRNSPLQDVKRAPYPVTESSLSIGRSRQSMLPLARCPALLSAARRSFFEALPTESGGLAKHYLLSDEDLAPVRERRRLENRLGFAIQLCLGRTSIRADFRRFVSPSGNPARRICC